MAESLKVWVRTPLLSSIINGKSSSVSSRALPDADPTEDDSKINWGWARGTLDAKVDDLDGKSGLKVFIQDEESEFDRETVEIPADKVKDGVVMANIYGDGNEEEEDQGFDDYDEYEGYDDFGGGGDNFEQSGSKKCIYPDDLITLTHLHEPAVVFCLRKRYALDKIYTATGPILLALNPFKNCKSLYSEKVMKDYWKQGESDAILSGEEKKDDPSGGVAEEPATLPPHVYAIADHSFRSMMTALEAARGGGRSRDAKSADQSILVSGESGAGKTVTTKFIMSYLAKLSERGSASKRNLANTGIESQVLGSNPILEAWGNARTIRNDNSSRFGKFIEIQFTKDGLLVGANIETYLLEKVRLITQAPGERNYHIFYMILSGFSDEQMDKYFLTDYTIEDFKMTSSSGTYDRRDGVDDYDCFGEMIEAMDTMGFSDEEVHSVLLITAACLHCSNLQFVAVSEDESKIDDQDPHLDSILNLLGVDHKALESALCTFSITAGRERHVRSLSKHSAEKGMEALIKATYGALFTYIVKKVNDRITVPTGGKATRGPSKAANIGVLDIFGFESFKHNSFEQLCINYCNEALQQQFNMFVLKNEQAEYEKEGIQWSFISFPDNQDVLDLIDKKNTGILSILDGHCKAPGGSDKTFATDIYKICKASSRFEANFRQVGANKFGVVHYAGQVEYDTVGFVEKNKDELPREATDLLLSSSLPVLKALAGILDGSDSASPTTPTAGAGGPAGRRAPPRRAGGAAPGGRKKGRQTVGGQFSLQLTSLRNKIDVTSPHYVRCLKPNDLLVPDHFNPLIISDQLRCAGVVEAVRVSRVGYPQRYSHPLFVNRYKILGLKAMKAAMRSSRRQRPVDVLVAAIAKSIMELDDPEYKKQADEEAAKAKRSRGGRAPPSSLPPVDLVAIGMQVGKTKVFLRRQAFDKIERLRSYKLAEAAVRIQKIGRGFNTRNAYRRFRWAVIKLQGLRRARIAGEELKARKEDHASTVMGAYYRRYAALRRFKGKVTVARGLQRRYRGIKGRRRYESLNRIRKSIVIQKYWRRHVKFRLWKKQRLAIPTIQRAFRCYKARMVIKELKAQSRNLAATAEERDALKKEVASLKSALAKAQREAKNEREIAAKAVKEAKSVSGGEEKKLAEIRKETDAVKKELEDMKKKMETEKKRANEAEEKLSEEKRKTLEASKKASSEGTRAAKAEMALIKETTRADKAQNAEKSATAQVAKMEEETAKLQKELKEAEEYKVMVEERDAEIGEMQGEIDKYKKDMEDMEEELEMAKRQAAEQAVAAVPAPVVEQAPAPPQAPQVDPEQLKELNDEIEELRFQLADEKMASANAKAEAEEQALRTKRLENQLREESDRVSQLEVQIRDQPAKNDIRGPGGALATMPSGSMIVKSFEYEQLQANCESLALQLANAHQQLTEQASASLGHSAAPMRGGVDAEELEEAKLEIRFLKKQMRELQSSTVDEEEVQALRIQVSQLERQLENAKTVQQQHIATSSSASSSVDHQLPPPSAEEGSKNTERRYSELRRMANTLMEKDEELSNLRSQLSTLKKSAMNVSALSFGDDSYQGDVNEQHHQQQQQQNRNRSNNNNRRHHHDYDEDEEGYDHDENSIHSPISLEDDNDARRSHIFNFRNKIKNALGSSRNVVNSSSREVDRQEVLCVEDASALRAVNEMLRNELETTRKELEDVQQKLKDEIERGQKDLEAFAEALHGVDELRRSAEMMSRQLKKMKVQKKRRQEREFNGGGGQYGRGHIDDDEMSVQSMATHVLEDAGRNIKNMEAQRKTNPIWGKISDVLSTSVKNMQGETEDGAHSG